MKSYVFLFCLGLAACSSEEPEPGTVGVLNNTISGGMCSDWDIQANLDLTGSQVVPDDGGSFSWQDVTAGTHTVTFSRPGGGGCANAVDPDICTFNVAEGQTVVITAERNTALQGWVLINCP